VDARARRVAARLLPSRVLPARARRLPSDPPARHGVAAYGRSAGRHPLGTHPAGRARELLQALKNLEDDGWVVLSGLRRPGGGRAIDHIAIGPGGLVVIDSGPWVGMIEVTRGVVQQNGFWRERECAAVAGTAGGIAALLLPQHRTAVHAVICVAQDLTEHVVTPGVHVVGAPQLRTVLHALPHRLHPAEVAHLNHLIRHTLMDGEPPDQLTTADLDGRPGTGWPSGRHREAVPVHPVADLFVPMEGKALRTAARGAARRRRLPGPRWHNHRIATARLLLAALIVVGVGLLGPGLIRAATEAHSIGVGTTLLPAAVDGTSPVGPSPVGPSSIGPSSIGPSSIGASSIGPSAGPSSAGTASP
jgi:hypothetical protein